MKLMLWRASVALLGFLSAAVVSTHSTIAQQASSKSALAVSPAINEQVLDPGKPSTTTVRVTNITRVPLPIKSSVKNLILNEQLPSGASKQIYDASAWFTVNPADFILQPNETKSVTVTINTPSQATPGGHYATVYFQPLVPEEALSPSTTYLNARVGVLSFLIVKGDIHERAGVAGLGVPKLQQFGPIQIRVPVRNEGNVHVLPKGTVTIKDYRGRNVASLPLSKGMVLPNTTRSFYVNWNNKGSIGPFTISAEIRYGQDETVIHVKPVKVWILPWVPLTIAVVCGMLLLWFVVRTRRRWKAAWRAFRGDSE